VHTDSSNRVPTAAVVYIQHQQGTYSSNRVHRAALGYIQTAATRYIQQHLGAYSSNRIHTAADGFIQQEHVLCCCLLDMFYFSFWWPA